MTTTVRPGLKVALAVFAALALAVTAWTWLVFECLPLEMYGNNDVHLYTECEALTAVARLLINLMLLVPAAGATALAAVVSLSVRWALKRARAVRLRYDSHR